MLFINKKTKKGAEKVYEKQQQHENQEQKHRGMNQHDTLLILCVA